MLQQQQQQQQQTIEEPCNNIVAQSEYEAALAAIESTFDNFRLSSRSRSQSQSQSQSQQRRQHHNRQNENDENPDDQQHQQRQHLDQEMIEGIYEAAKKSLLNNVKRVVRPINDNSYSDYVDQYHIVLDEESDDDNDNDNDDDDDQDAHILESKDNKDDDEEEEIDEEELVDMKAWKNAQELRTRIRTMSSTVQSIRERVLKRTEDGISSSISTHLVDKPIQIVFAVEDDNDNSNNNNNNSSNSKEEGGCDINTAIAVGDASNNKENNVKNTCNGKHISKNIVGRNNSDSSSLKDSLKDLSKLLQDPQWTRLPNRIQSLQDTIETIQKETTEDRIMSQTEIAITSRYKDTIDESSSRRKFLEEDCGEDRLSNNNTIKPMDRLALFGQLFS